MKKNDMKEKEDRINGMIKNQQNEKREMNKDENKLVKENSELGREKRKIREE